MKKVLCLLLAMLMALSVVGCGKEDPVEDINKFRIVTSFYPVYVVTANLTDGAQDVSLTNLTEPDHGCMHNYSLTTEDMKKLTGTNLFVASGMNMEVFVGKTSLGIPRLVVLDSGEDIPTVIKADGKENPHYWMNIENAISQCDKIKRALIRANPVNESVYEENATRYKDELNALLAETYERTSKLKGKKLVVFSDSFDYFAEEFGIETVKLASAHNGKDPSAKEIAEAVDYIKSNDVKTVFAIKGEEGSPVVRTVKKETGCKVVLLDVLTSGELDGNVKNAYIEAIRSNLDALENNL